MAAVIKRIVRMRVPGSGAAIAPASDTDVRTGAAPCAGNSARSRGTVLLGVGRPQCRIRQRIEGESKPRGGSVRVESGQLCGLLPWVKIHAREKRQDAQGQSVMVFAQTCEQEIIKLGPEWRLWDRRLHVNLRLSAAQDSAYRELPSVRWRTLRRQELRRAHRNLVVPDGIAEFGAAPDANEGMACQPVMLAGGRLEGS